MLMSVAAGIDAAGQLHKSLANGLGEHDADLGKHLKRICSTLEPMAALKGPVDFSCSVGPVCFARKEEIVPVAFIVCEMITNAIKHAHPAGAPGTIVVSGVGDETITMIEIADDGVGLPEGFDPKTDGGLGFQLVRSLAKQLGATFVFDSDSLGLRFQLLLPKRKAKNGH